MHASKACAQAATAPEQGAAASARDRILDAAQQLFAQEDSVSMRDIAAQAGVGLPLIVITSRPSRTCTAPCSSASGRCSTRLTALHAPVAPGVDPLEHRPRAGPAGGAGTGREAGVAYAKLVARSVGPARSRARHRRGVFRSFAVEFVHAIRTVLPRQDPDYAHWAYLYAVGALVMSVFDRRIERISEGQTHAGDLKNKAEYLVRFIVAGMRAGLERA